MDQRLKGQRISAKSAAIDYTLAGGFCLLLCVIGLLVMQSPPPWGYAFVAVVFSAFILFFVAQAVCYWMLYRAYRGVKEVAVERVTITCRKVSFIRILGGKGSPDLLLGLVLRGEDKQKVVYALPSRIVLGKSKSVKEQLIKQPIELELYRGTNVARRIITDIIL